MPFDTSDPGCLHNDTYCGLKLGFWRLMHEFVENSPTGEQFRLVFLENKIFG